MGNTTHTASRHNLNPLLEVFANNQVKHLVSNIETTSLTMEVEGIRFPVTVNWSEYHNSYVCSLYAGYIRYALQELGLLGNRALSTVLSIIGKCCGSMIQFCEVDKVVQVNNWLYPTNLYEDIDHRHLRRLTDKALDRLPEHAVVMRSLNHECSPSILQTLQDIGYRLIPSRQVYIFDSRKDDFMQKRMTKSDKSLLAKSNLTVVEHDELTPKDYPRIKYLYDSLYLIKHSKLNPDFTETYIKLCHESRSLVFIGLRDQDGVLQGVAGYSVVNQTMVTHLIGYETQCEVNSGIYRMLIYLILRESVDQNVVLNLSSGASHFKKLRGGKPVIEFMAVYDRHLPLRRRFAFAMMETLGKHIGIPLLKKYGL